MKKLFLLLILGAAAVPALTGSAAAQSPMNLPSAFMESNQGQTSSNSAPATELAPSDMALQASGTPERHRSHARQARPFSTSYGTGSNPAANALNLPHVCFQPGIGWTSISSSTKDNPADTRPPGASPSQPIHRGISRSDKSRQAVECSPAPLMQAATAGMSHDDFAEHSGVDLLNPLLYASQDAETNSAQANPSLNVSGGLKRSGGQDLSDPNATLEMLKALRGRAYVSPVKLRQLSRDIPDLQTRLELRRLQTEVEKQEKSKRTKENQGSLATEHKQADRRDLWAKKHDCAQRAGASRSKVCSLPKSSTR